jgi:hypothetical protein
MGYAKNLGKSIAFAIPAEIQNSLRSIYDLGRYIKNPGDLKSDAKAELNELKNFIKSDFVGPAKALSQGMKNAAKRGNFSKDENSDIELGNDVGSGSFDDMMIDTGGSNETQNVSDFGVSNSIMESTAMNVAAQTRIGSKVAGNVKINSAITYEIGMANFNILKRIASDANTYHQSSLGFFGQMNDSMTGMLSELKALKVVSADTRILAGSSAMANILTGNRFNVSKYMGFLRDKFRDKAGIGTMMLDQIGQNPIGEMFAMLLNDTKIGKKVNSLNDTLGLAPLFLLNRFVTKGKNSSSGVFSSLAKFLEIDSPMASNVRLDGQRLDKVPFDGETKRSIVEVIPTLLSKILSAIRRDDPKNLQIYDHTKGIFVKKSTLINEYKTGKKNATLSGMTGKGNISDIVDKNYMFKDKIERDSFIESLAPAMLERARDNKLLTKSSSFGDSKAEQQLKHLTKVMTPVEITKLNMSMIDMLGRVKEFNTEIVKDNLEYNRSGSAMRTALGMEDLGKLDSDYSDMPNFESDVRRKGQKSEKLQRTRAIQQGKKSRGNIFSRFFSSISDHINYTLVGGGNYEGKEKPLLFKMYDKFSVSVEKLVFGRDSDKNGFFSAVGSKAKSLFTQMTETMTKTFAPMKEWISTKFKDKSAKAKNWFMESIWTPVKSKIFGADKQNQSFSDLTFGALFTSLQGITDKIKNFFNTKIKDPVKNFLFGNGEKRGVLTGLKEGVMTFFKDINEKIFGDTGFIKKSWKNIQHSLIHPIRDFLVHEKTGLFNKEFKTKFTESFVTPVKEYFMGNKSSGKMGIFAKMTDSVFKFFDSKFNKGGSASSFSEVVQKFFTEKFYTPLHKFFVGDKANPGIFVKIETGMRTHIFNPMREYLVGDGKERKGALNKIRDSINLFLFGDGKDNKGVIDKYLKPAKEFITREIFTPFKNVMNDTFKDLKIFFKNEVIAPLKESFFGFTETFKHRIVEMYHEGKTIVKDAFGMAFGFANRAIGGMISKSGESLTKLMQKNVLEPLKDALNEVRKSALSVLKSMIKFPVNILTSTFDNTKINSLLQGKGGHLPIGERKRLLKKYQTENDIPGMNGWGKQKNLSKNGKVLVMPANKRVDIINGIEEAAGEKRGFFSRFFSAFGGNKLGVTPTVVDKEKAAKETKVTSFRESIAIQVAEVADKIKNTDEMKTGITGIFQLLQAKFRGTKFKGVKGASSASGSHAIDFEETDSHNTKRANRAMEFKTAQDIHESKVHLKDISKNTSITNKILQYVHKIKNAGVLSRLGGFAGDLATSTTGLLGKLTGLVTHPIKFLSELGSAIVSSTSTLIQETLSAVFKPIRRVLDGIGTALMGAGKLIGDAAVALGDFVKGAGILIKDTLFGIGKGLRGLITTTGMMVSDFAQNLIPVMKTMGKLAADLTTVIGTVIGGTLHIVKNAGGALLSGIASIFSGDEDGGSGGKKSFVDKIKGAFRSKTKTVMISKILDVVKVYVVGGRIAIDPKAAKYTNGVNLGNKASKIASGASQSANTTVSPDGEVTTHGAGVTGVLTKLKSSKLYEKAEEYKEQMLKAGESTVKHLAEMREGLGVLGTIMMAGFTKLIATILASSMFKSVTDLLGGGARGGGGRIGQGFKRAGARLTAFIKTPLGKGVGAGGLVALGGGLLADVTTDEGSTANRVIKTTASTAGYAMMGAAIGTAIAPGVGTAVGAVLGGVTGFALENMDLIKSTFKSITTVIGGKDAEYNKDGSLKSGAKWGIVDSIGAFIFGNDARYDDKGNVIIAGQKNMLSKAGGWLSSIMTGAADGVTNAFNSAVDSVSSYVSGVVTSIGTGFDNLWAKWKDMDILTEIGNMFDSIVEYIKGIPGRVWSSAKETASSAVDSTKGYGRSLLNSFSSNQTVYRDGKYVTVSGDDVKSYGDKKKYGLPAGLGKDALESKLESRGFIKTGLFANSLVPEAVSKLSKTDIHDMLMLHNNAFGEYFSDEELAMIRVQERSIEGISQMAMSKAASNVPDTAKTGSAQFVSASRPSTPESRMINAADNSTTAKGIQRNQDSPSVMASQQAAPTIGVIADTNMLAVLNAIAINTKATADKELVIGETPDQKKKNDALLNRMEQNNNSTGFFGGNSFFNSSKISNANQIASGY